MEVKKNTISLTLGENICIAIINAFAAFKFALKMCKQILYTNIYYYIESDKYL